MKISKVNLWFLNLELSTHSIKNQEEISILSMVMLKHLRTLFCLTILLCLTAQISFAQSGFTLTGGYNMSKIKFKDDNNPLGNLDNEYKGGFNIGLEKHAGNLIVGASFLQRGSTLKEPYSLGERLSEGLLVRTGLFFKLGNN